MQTRVLKLHDKHDIRIETESVDALGPGGVLVRIGAGGICGSDLHYFHDGGFGPIRVREPITLGHEIAGTIEAVGEGVSGLEPGMRVAINPSRPCNHCRYCLEGLQQHCENMLFFGSAMRMPHVQGGFRDRMVVEARQCVPVTNPAVSLGEAAAAEPLAVCLHAQRRAGDLSGAKVLVTGAGPIGALTVAVARQAGAGHIVVTDLQDPVLAIAARMGADETINMATNASAFERHTEGKGTFDVVFECTAAAPAIEAAIRATRPQGTIVQVGVAGALPVPINAIVGKEIAFVGSHRFHAEYERAVRLIDTGAIDVKPILSATYDLADAQAAFAHAGDRSRAVKVQLSFEAA